MAKLIGKSGDPDQTPHYAASDLGLHCLPIPFGVSRLLNGLTFSMPCKSSAEEIVKAAVFNTFQGTWRMLMYCKTMFDQYYCIKTENICYISR